MPQTITLPLPLQFIVLCAPTILISVVAFPQLQDTIWSRWPTQVVFPIEVPSGLHEINFSFECQVLSP